MTCSVVCQRDSLSTCCAAVSADVFGVGVASNDGVAISQSDDVDELDGFIALGGAGSDIEDEPSYKPPNQRSSGSEAASFMDKIEQQGKKKRQENSGSGNVKEKKRKR